MCLAYPRTIFTLDIQWLNGMHAFRRVESQCGVHVKTCWFFKKILLLFFFILFNQIMWLATRVRFKYFPVTLRADRSLVNSSSLNGVHWIWEWRRRRCDDVPDFSGTGSAALTAPAIRPWDRVEELPASLMAFRRFRKVGEKNFKQE